MLPDIGNCRQPKPEHIYLPLGAQKPMPTHPTPVRQSSSGVCRREKLLMKNEFATSAELATCSRGNVLGLNYDSDLLTTVLQTLKAV